MRNGDIIVLSTHTMALGERALAPATAPRDMIFIKIGNGIGAGITGGEEAVSGKGETAGGGDRLLAAVGDESHGKVDAELSRPS